MTKEFADLRQAALALGFRHVESGPLVRSSYHAKRHTRAASDDPRAPVAASPAP